MKVSIVIVNYNGRNVLKTILQSIAKSSFRDFETIVVDNDSSDGSQDFVRKNFKNVKLVINNKNLGYVGINSGLKYCNGDYILFLNNDMEIDKDCIKNLVKAIESDKSIAMAAPKLVNFYNKNIRSGGTWVSRAFYNGHIKGEINPEHPEELNEIPYLGVGLIRKKFADSFGYLFDPDYFIYAEDLDLGLRVRLNGKKVVFEPSAIMFHMHSLTMQKTTKSYATYLMERNLLTTFLKILYVKNILLFLPYVLFSRLTAILRDLLTLKIGLALARLKALFYILFNFGFIMKKRQQTQKYRKANDAYILKVFSERYLFKPKFII